MLMSSIPHKLYIPLGGVKLNPKHPSIITMIWRELKPERNKHTAKLFGRYRDLYTPKESPEVRGDDGKGGASEGIGGVSGNDIGESNGTEGNSPVPS